MARYFKEKSWDVHIMDLDRNRPRPNCPGITLHLFKPDQEIAADMLSIACGAGSFLARLIKKIQPSILHSHYITFHGWLAAMVSYPPTIATAWGSDLFIEARSSEFVRRMASFVLKSAAFTTSDSMDLMDEIALLRDCRKKSELILFGIDTNRFIPGLDTSVYAREIFSKEIFTGKIFARKIFVRQLPGGKDLDDSPLPHVVLSPRQFKPPANVHVIIDAIPAVLQKHPDTIFILKSYLTEGSPFDSYAARLKDQARDLGVLDNIIFMQDVPDDAMPLLYNLADVTLSLRDTDGAACTVLESMSCATPVITGKIPSMTEWIDDGKNGFLIDHTSSSELSSVLNRLFEDRTLLDTLGASARETAVRRADYKANWDRLEGFYREVAARWKQTSQKPDRNDAFQFAYHHLWNDRAFMAEKLFGEIMRYRDLTVYDCLKTLAGLATAAALRGNKGKSQRTFQSIFELMSNAELDTPMQINIK